MTLTMTASQHRVFLSNSQFQRKRNPLACQERLFSDAGKLAHALLLILARMAGAKGPTSSLLLRSSRPTLA